MTPEESFEKWWAGKYSGWTVVEAAKVAWLEATRQAYENSANMLNLSRSEALLMAGEMTAQEWRTVSAILVALQSRIRKEYDNGN